MFFVYYILGGIKKKLYLCSPKRLFAKGAWGVTD